MDKINLIQSWSRYNNKVQTLQKVLGLSEEKTERFHKPDSKQADDSSRKTFVCGNRYMPRKELHKEVLKQYGHSAIHLLMESYVEGALKKSPSAPPKQEVVDKVLIKRSLAHGDRLKDLEETIRKLEAAKGHLKKELKDLEAQNEFFGNGKHLQTADPHVLSLNFHLRKETKNTNPLGTDFLKGLEMDDPLMDEIVEEVMSANLSLQPQKRDPATKARIEKQKLELSRDHAIILTKEEIILELLATKPNTVKNTCSTQAGSSIENCSYLEFRRLFWKPKVTSEMSKQIVLDVVKRKALSTEFDSRFDSAEVQEYLKSTNPLDF